MARFYGVNPFALRADERVGLIGNLGRIKAIERIERGDFDGLNHEGIYQLYLAAYEDKDRALKAKIEWLESYVDRSCNAAASKK